MKHGPRREPSESTSGELHELIEVFGESVVKRLDQYAGLLASQAVPLGLVGFDHKSLAIEVRRSLLLAPLVGRSNFFVDVGTGAGLPGVPLALTGIQGILVEPRRKAISFLELVVRELDLDVQILEEPAELLGRGDWRESFDVAIARALAQWRVALELSAPLVRPGGRIILTSSRERRLVRSEGPAWTQLGLANVETRHLAEKDIHQVVHIVQKTGVADPLLPRGPGVARRRPLEW